MRMLQRYPTPSPATVVHATERERLSGMQESASRRAPVSSLAYDATMEGEAKGEAGPRSRPAKTTTSPPRGETVDEAVRRVGDAHREGRLGVAGGVARADAHLVRVARLAIEGGGGAESRRRAVESCVCSVFHPGFGIEYLSSANSIDVGAIFRI